MSIHVMHDADLKDPAHDDARVRVSTIVVVRITAYNMCCSGPKSSSKRTLGLAPGIYSKFPKLPLSIM